MELEKENGVNENQQVTDPIETENQVIDTKKISLITLIILFVFIVSRFLPSSAPKQKYIETPQVTQSLDQYVSPTVVNVDPVTSKQNKVYVIQQKTESDTEDLYRFGGENDLLRWKNYLLFTTHKRNGDREVLYSLNLDTGYKKQLFEEKNQPLEIGNLSEVNNTLFFASSSYVASNSAMYSLDLPSGIPHKVITGGVTHVQNIKNQYWLISLKGAECHSEEDYSLLDTRTKIPSLIAQSWIGCAAGLEYKGIDNEKRMIMAYHPGYGGDFGDEANNVYTYITAIPLSSPKQKIDVIPASKMPESILSVYYDDQSNSLLLIGKTINIFDLTTNKFVFQMDIPASWTDIGVLYWNTKSVCLTYDLQKDRTSYYLNSKLPIKNDKNCLKYIVPEMKDQATDPQAIFKQLNLPQNYQLVSK